MLDRINPGSKKNFKITVNLFDEITRLDVYVSKHVPFLSRSLAVKMLNFGDILVNGKQEKKDYIPKIGD